MLNFENIKDVRFSKKIFGGYDAFSVDKFMDEIQNLILNFDKEHTKLKEEIKILKDEINCYKNEEVSIRKAIANSQKIADAAIIDAGVQSKYILKDASDKAYGLLNRTKNDIRKKLDISKSLYEYFVDFKKKLTENYKEQIVFLENLNFEDTNEIEKYLDTLEDEYVNFCKNEKDIINICDNLFGNSNIIKNQVKLEKEITSI